MTSGADIVSELAPLFRSHAAPSLPQGASLLRRQRAEPLVAGADPFLFLGRKRPEFLVPFPDQCPLFRRQLPPSLEALPCLCLLFGVHLEPPLRSPAQSLTALGLELVPTVRVRSQHLLLILAQISPGVTTQVGPCRYRQGHNEEQRKQSESSMERICEFINHCFLPSWSGPVCRRALPWAQASVPARTQKSFPCAGARALGYLAGLSSRHPRSHRIPNTPASPCPAGPAWLFPWPAHCPRPAAQG